MLDFSYIDVCDRYNCLYTLLKESTKLLFSIIYNKLSYSEGMSNVRSNNYNLNKVP